MQSKEMQKLVFKDGDNTKAITCEILKEDDFFIFIKAAFTNKDMRIGKSSIVSIKPINNGGGR